MSAPKFALLLIICTAVQANVIRDQFLPIVIGRLMSLDNITNAECRRDLILWVQAVQSFTTALETSQNCTTEECVVAQQETMAETKYAMQQLDSFGWPMPGLLSLRNRYQGSWEECMAIKASYRTEFCWVQVAPDIEKLGGPDMPITAPGCNSVLQIAWSICMPRSCSSEDVTAFVRSFNNQTMGYAEFCSAECIVPDKPPKHAGFWVVTVYCIIVIVLMIVSTVVDYVTTADAHPAFKNFRSTTLGRVVLTFSVYTNGAEILTVTKRPGQIDSINCLRAFSMTWVMVGHMLSSYESTGDNMLDLLGTTNAFLNDAFLNAFVSVDTFLFLGGVLVAYLFYKEMDRNPRSCKNPVYWILFYVHRILRLSPAYFLFLGFFVVMQEQLTTGPLQVSHDDMEVCRKYWWHNILYINNLFSTTKSCMGHTWYLAVDMQFHILAPLLLLPLLFSKIAGIVVAILFTGGSIAATYATYYHYHFEPTIVGLVLKSPELVDSYFKFIYYPPWIRCTPYIVGVLTGYVLHKMRNKHLRFHPIIVIALWVAAVGMGIACVFGLYGYFKGTSHLTTLDSSSYYAWHRIAWSLSLAWIIFACQHNMAGFLKNFMELGMWAPLGRLTYCAYLTHQMVIDVIDAQRRQSLHYVSITESYIHRGLPVFICSYVFAFFWSCGFELPFGKLEKMATDALIRRTKPSTNHSVWGNVPAIDDKLDEKRICSGMADGDAKVETGNDYGNRANGNVYSSHKM